MLIGIVILVGRCFASTHPFLEAAEHFISRLIPSSSLRPDDSLRHMSYLGLSEDKVLDLIHFALERRRNRHLQSVMVSDMFMEAFSAKYGPSRIHPVFYDIMNCLKFNAGRTAHHAIACAVSRYPHLQYGEILNTLTIVVQYFSDFNELTQSAFFEFFEKKYGTPFLDAIRGKRRKVKGDSIQNVDTPAVARRDLGGMGEVDGVRFDSGGIGAVTAPVGIEELQVLESAESGWLGGVDNMARDSDNGRQSFIYTNPLANAEIDVIESLLELPGKMRQQATTEEGSAGGLKEAGDESESLPELGIVFPDARCFIKPTCPPLTSPQSTSPPLTAPQPTGRQPVPSSLKRVTCADDTERASKRISADAADRSSSRPEQATRASKLTELQLQAIRSKFNYLIQRGTPFDFDDRENVAEFIRKISEGGPTPTIGQLRSLHAGCLRSQQYMDDVLSKIRPL